MEKYKANKYSMTIKYVLLPYFVLVLSHLITINKFFAPWIMPDENIYLAHARFFAGLPFYIFEGLPYSNFGYSLFITPIFWLAKNPEIIYKLAIVFNAFLLSTLYIIIYFILKKIFNKDDKTALILSLLVSFIPGIFLRANMVLVENIFIPLFYLSILLFYLLVKKVSYTRAILFSLIIILLFATHYRALPIFFVAFLLLLYLFFRLKYSRPIFLALILLILGFFGINQLNQYLMSIAWHNPAEYSIANLLPHGYFLKKITFLFSAFAGQLLYLIIASYGLILYALLYSFYLFKGICQDKKNRNNLSIFIIYVFLICLGIFFSSVATLAVNTDFTKLRADHFIYGRYNEILLPLVLILGLGSLDRLFISKKQLSVIFITLTIFLLIGARFFILHSTYGSTSIVSFFYVRYFGPIISGIFALVTLLIFLQVINKIKKLYPRALLIFLLFIFNITCYYQIELFDNNKISGYQQKIIPILKSSGVKSVNFDLRSYKYFADDPIIDGRYWYRSYYLTQHYLPNIKVYAVYSLDQNQLNTEAVITHCSWENNDYYLKEKILLNNYLANNSENCLALWLKNK